MSSRVGELTRKTSETEIKLRINLDGSGHSTIDTGVPFFDHMLTALSKHSLIDIDCKAVGDVEIDAHHTVEDVGIALGSCLKSALGDRSGISRFGSAFVPLDESLSHAVVDISGRPLFVNAGLPAGFEFHLIGGHFAGSLVAHFFESLAHNAAITLHVRVLSGRDAHHLAESQFKAVARALRAAIELDARVKGVPSTKGSL